MKFLSKLQIEFLDPEDIRKIGLSVDEPHAQLTAPLLFELSGGTYEIPVGFITDFASVPRSFWSIFPPYDSRYAKAAVIHDYGYQSQGFYKIAGASRSVPIGSRWDVDLLFISAMEAQGTSWIPRHIIFRAVRSFGFIPWNRYQKLL